MSQKSGSLGRYIATRVLLAIPMIFVLLTLVFVMLRVAPGDPISASAGGAKLSDEKIAELRHAAGYDKPLIEQYGSYLADVVQFDFGRSISTNQQVSDVILDKGGATVTLATGALVFALLLGIPVGLLAGRFRDSGFDVFARLFGIITYAAPVFVVGLLAQQLFATKLGWLPLDGQTDPLIANDIPATTHILIIDAIWVNDWEVVFNILWHLVLPACTLGLLIVGVFIRMVRINLIQTLRGDYVEAARARGIRERDVVTKHGFRNALVPVITVIGLQVALLLGGSVLTEKTFNWPGLGKQLIEFLNSRDYVAVQGIVTFIALVVVVISMLIDIINALIDPRVRY